MRLSKKDSIHYSRNIKIAIIISEIIILLLFILVPYPSEDKEKKIYFPENLITVMDIPRTEVIPPKPGGLPPPTPTIPTNFELVEDPEILPDVEIPDISSLTNRPSQNNGISQNQNGEYYASSFPFVPRQILEVVPNRSEGMNGYIKLSLRIGKDGFVKNYRILSNTIKDQKSLKNILDAVYKSRWQPISIEGEKIEYWIDKTYSFN